MFSLAMLSLAISIQIKQKSHKFSLHLDEISIHHSQQVHTYVQYIIYLLGTISHAYIII